MKYEISIRVTFPEKIMNVLKREKHRFVTEYGSRYKSEPHITLYLDSYTADGYPKLLTQLRKLYMEPFTISLLQPKVRVENDRQRNLYVMDVSNKKKLSELHDKIMEVAIPCRSSFIREKTQKELEHQGIYTDGSHESLKAYQISEEIFDPHITLGEISFDKPQADIEEVGMNLQPITGKEIMISTIVVFFYQKEADAEKFKLIEEVAIPFQT